jgi:hypothetical protein
MLKNILAVGFACFAMTLSVSLPAFASDSNTNDGQDEDVVQVPEPTNILPLVVIGVGLASKKIADLKNEKK